MSTELEGLEELGEWALGVDPALAWALQGRDYILVRLEVRVAEGVTGRPDKKDCRFFFPDGREWLGPVTSASAENKFDDCQRAWGLYAIEKLPQKDKPSALLGQRAHKELEEWLEHGIYPTYDRMIKSGILEQFPMPRTPGLAVEQVFAFAFAPSSNEEDMVVWWGFKDVEHGSTVQDLKSTSDLRWAKSEAELLEDTQAIVYAVDNMLQTGQAEAHLEWDYFTTRGTIAKRPTQVTVGLHHCLELLTKKHVNAAQMRDIRAAEIRGMELPPNPMSCGNYGGCDYVNVCQLKAVNSFISRIRQDSLKTQRGTTSDAPAASTTGGKTPTQETRMGILDKMKADGKKSGTTPAPATKVPVGTKPAPAATTKPTTKPTTPPAKAAPAASTKSTSKPAPAPAAKAAPAAAAKPTTTAAGGGKLKTFLSKTKPAEPAEEVVPDDAPEAAAEEENEEEVVAEEGVEGEEGTEAVEEEAAEEEAPAPPPKKKVTAKKPTPAPAAEPEEPAAAEELATGAQFVLYVDAVVVKGLEGLVQDVEALIGPCRTEVETDAQSNYRLIEFNKGPDVLAAQLEEAIKASKPLGRFHVSSRIVDRSVLETLVRYADVVVKGGF